MRAGFLALVLTACMPELRGHLTVPVHPVGDTALDAAVVDIELDELARRMEHVEPGHLAVYARGREPIPHTLVDHDDDGHADAVRVVVPLPADGRLLMLVSPAPGAPGDPDLASADGLGRVDWNHTFR